MNFKLLTLYVFALAVFCQTSADAAVTVIDKNASPFEVSIAGSYVDDINPTLVGELGAYGALLMPKGKIVKSAEGIDFLVDYSAQLAQYKLDEEIAGFDNTQDFHQYKIKLLSRFYLTNAWFFDAHVEHVDETQRFGEGISQLRENVLNADRLKQNKVGASVVYGNDTSSRFISLSAFSNDMRYQPINDYSHFFNIVATGIEFDLAFKQSEASSLLFRLSMTDEDFEAIDRQDSQVYQGLVGMSWKPSGKTKLEALVGMFSREFDSLDSSSGLSWALDFSTQPSEQWLFQLKSTRFSGVSKSDITSSSVEQNVDFKLTLKASERWHFALTLLAAKVEFEEPDFVSELTENSAELSVVLHMKGHSNVSLGFATTDQSFDNGLNDYQQNEARLMWHVAF